MAESPENEQNKAEQAQNLANAQEQPAAETSELSPDDFERATEAYTPHENAPDTEEPVGDSLPSSEQDQPYDYSMAESDDDIEEYVSSEADEDEPISLEGKRVLLIEDDVETAEILTYHLKDMGIDEVEVVQAAEGALTLLVTDPELFPDIIVLELALVGMDGIQFLAQLRAHKSKRLQNMPAVVITMLDSPSIYRRAARQKVGAFLRKPVSSATLRQGLEDALSGKIVEKPFSQPKSWLDEVDEQELKAKREAIKEKASARVRKMGLLARLMDAIIPWSGKA